MALRQDGGGLYADGAGARLDGDHRRGRDPPRRRAGASPRSTARGDMTANRWMRFADCDKRPLRLDKFAREDPANGFSAMTSPGDPRAGVSVVDGRIAEMDGVAAADFDMIDRFIATYHLDPAVAPGAMAVPALDIARMLVDMGVPR